MTDKEKKKEEINKKRFTPKQRPYDVARNRGEGRLNYRSNQDNFKKRLDERIAFAKDITNRGSTGAFSGERGQFDPQEHPSPGEADMYQRGESLGLNKGQIDNFIKSGPANVNNDAGDQAQQDRLQGAGGLQGARERMAGNDGNPQNGAGGEAPQRDIHAPQGEQNGPGGARGLTTGSERNQLFSQGDRDSAKSMRKQSRAYNLAYRQKIRQGDRTGALDILNDANEKGVSFGGVRSANFFENQAQQDRNTGFKRGVNPNGRPNKRLGLQEEEDEDDAMF